MFLGLGLRLGAWGSGFRVRAWGSGLDGESGEKMEHEMGPALYGVFHGDSSIQILPTLDPKVSNSYLH